ncbi:hypothetical protein KAT36_04715 [Candidatus Pacearchaeota archaeon]|nr:hypothetical protein [Candidatus Pacearchaeota archaeon]
MSYKTALKIFFLLVVIFLIGLFFIYLWSGITGAVVFEDHVYYTKAVCNETNFCQDYKIYCDGENFVKMVAIDGAMVQHSDDWEDPRSEERIAMLC